MQTLGEKIKVLRVAKGMTQEDLAGKLGYSKSFISYIESGERNLSDVDTDRIAKCLEVSAEDLRSKGAVVSFQFRSSKVGTDEEHRKVAQKFTDYARKLIEDSDSNQEASVWKGSQKR
ncbi:XRE family transcriptional regulator [Patescibacteria group bacterium]|nr:MAG: XRE family transcriptional regulator [Patescibacteria group bacterium]